MIELSKLVSSFISYALDELIKNHPRDLEAIEAVRKDDKGYVRKWLQAMSVMQGMKNIERDAVAETILEYGAGARANLSNEATDLFSEFDKLRNMLRKASNRDLQSLTSKALWCCYPNIVPLYDQFAVQSLSMLRKLLDIEPSELEKLLYPEPSGTSKPIYHQFAAAWSDIYGQCLPYIRMHDNRDYPHEVRIFDKMLWFIGKPTFYEQRHRA